MAFKKTQYFLLIVCFVISIDCSPLETNCTQIKSIDGSVGVDCHRTVQPNDPFEPTIIQQHFVDFFSRAKRDTNEEISETPLDLALSQLFIQNLEVMNQANMSECMDRVNCEEKCQLIADGVVKETAEDKHLEGLNQLPTFVRTFFEAGLRGIELGRSKQCSQCPLFYAKCNPMQYDYTIKTNALYKELIERNITLFESNDTKDDIPEEMLYLHHSMRFLDLANLSRCYARVSCEATCTHIKAQPNSEAPPRKSPLLAEDPHKPESVDIIHDGALLGYTLAFNGVCNTCAAHYSDCPPDRYTIAHTSSIIFG